MKGEIIPDHTSAKDDSVPIEFWMVLQNLAYDISSEAMRNNGHAFWTKNSTRSHYIADDTFNAFLRGPNQGERKRGRPYFP